MKSVYVLKGLDCPVCARKLEEGIAKDDSVSKASLSYPDGRLVLESEEEVSIASIQEIVDSLEDGVKVLPIEEKANIKKKEKDEFGRKIIILSVRIVIGLTLALLGLLLVNEERYGLWPNFAIMMVAYLILAYDVIWESIEDVFKKRDFFNEDTLMTVASLGAFALRFFGEASNEFFEAVMVMLLFQIGEVFETFALRRSHQAVLDAVGLKAKKARRIESDGTISEVPPEEIEIGNLIQIRVGDLIPVDSEVVEGEGLLDTSSLTGEFLPVEIKEGNKIQAGTLLKSGTLKIKALARYEDSSVAKILSLLEEGSEHRSKVDRFITKFSRYYTPIVMAIALIIAVIPPLFVGISDGATWERFIYTGLCCLVISCPCAIVISVPLSFFAGIGLSSKAGMVVRGSEYFDKLNGIKAVAVDKTGTLTEGKFVLSKTVNATGNKDFLYYLKAAESRSSHPIAEGILEGENPGTYDGDISHYEEIPGKGIVATVKGHEVIAASAKFLIEKGIELEPADEDMTTVYLAVDGVYQGYVTLEDKIRSTSKEMVDRLHERGIKVVLLTGDNPKNAERVASILGLDECHAGLTPEGKRDAILEIQKNIGPVAYIGDGINDAPSIVTSDVGFAMGKKGSDLAIENADVLLMEDDPMKVVTLLSIARKTTNKAISNIVIALLIKVAVMVLSIAIPEFPLYIAVLADTGTLALLILNALTLLWYKEGRKKKA